MKMLNIAATGMAAQEKLTAILSNNIANINTTGYKAQRGNFQDLFYEQVQKPGSSTSDAGTINPSGLQVGSGVTMSSTYRVHTQGGVVETGGDLDLMVSGKGYFQVTLPNGETAYTRDGSFRLDSNGNMETQDGYLLQPNITIPADWEAISINANGEVMVTINGQQGQVNVGQIQLANFVNQSGLEAIGNNLFKETTASGTAASDVPGAAGFGKIIAGHLEAGNVNVVSEITKLISAQRAYEMNSRAIKAADEMMRASTNVV